MSKDPRRSPCPVACTLDVLGDRWTLLVVRDLFCDKTSFKEFLASPEGIATNVLTDRLRRLERHGVVERRADERHPRRSSYHLTDAGRALWPILREVAKWGLEHVDGAEARLAPRRR